jgi:hypothetical protein
VALRLRAIDQFGQVIDVFVSQRRDAKAARRFFERAIGATKSVFPTFGRVCDSLLLVGVIGGRDPGWAG